MWECVTPAPVCSFPLTSSSSSSVGLTVGSRPSWMLSGRTCVVSLFSFRCPSISIAGIGLVRTAVILGCVPPCLAASCDSLVHPVSSVAAFFLFLFLAWAVFVRTPPLI